MEFPNCRAIALMLKLLQQQEREISVPEVFAADNEPFLPALLSFLLI
jgi:hypothetical protein